MNILYVEDDRLISELAKYIFVELDHTVIFCQTIQSAKSVIENEGSKIDLIFLDLLLPDGSGIDILDFMESSHSEIPVIVISGKIDSYRERLNEHLSKKTVMGVYSKPPCYDSIVSDMNTLFCKK
jgi:response regulator of citrate/malate metabolism